MDQTRDLTSGRTGDHATDPTIGPITVTVADAAKLLGLSAEAVRMRVKRGTLASTKVAGTVYVLVDQTDPRPNDRPTGEPNDQPNGRPNSESNDPAPLVRSLEDQVSYLRRQLATRDEEIRRRDHLLAAALERIPELEAPRGGRESPKTPSEAPEGADPRPADKGAENGAEPRPSWWRRVFGG